MKGRKSAKKLSVTKASPAAPKSNIPSGIFVRKSIRSKPSRAKARLRKNGGGRRLRPPTHPPGGPEPAWPIACHTHTTSGKPGPQPTYRHTKPRCLETAARPSTLQKVDADEASAPKTPEFSVRVTAWRPASPAGHIEKEQSHNQKPWFEHIRKAELEDLTAIDRRRASTDSRKGRYRPATAEIRAEGHPSACRQDSGCRGGLHRWRSQTEEDESERLAPVEPPDRPGNRITRSDHALSPSRQPKASVDHY